MLVRIAAFAVLGFAALLAVSPAQALSSHDCSVKYKAAQTAGTLNGMKYADFRKANCGNDATATPTAASTTPAATAPAATDDSEPTVANTANAPEPAAPTGVAPKGVVFPKAVNPKYASLSAGKQRMETCLDQYHANKANNALGGLKWIQKGGGFYSLCNAKLKS
jgi:hypothetical protein